MFNKDRDMINQKIKRMNDTFRDAFSSLEKKEVEDPELDDNLSREEALKIVNAYVDQGFSKRQAFIRIANRMEAKLGRRITYRGIESKYYKAMGECTA